ncbi:MAG TPA: tetratricopeptide repeat protein [Patescibacteria group bacterium]|nr:tetratricopeptide repeat protein [Patescibacteria group bacterium]
MQNNLMISKTLQKISLVLLSVALLVFPLVFTTLTTDNFAMPKQIIIILAVSLALVLYGAQMIAEKKLRFRVTPLDLPIFLFLVAVLASAIFATNRADALTAFVPLLFAVLGYFVITNIVRSEKEILFLVSALVGGGILSGLVSSLSFFKLYLIPMAGTHMQAFTTFGSLLDQSIYLIIVLPLAAYLAMPVFQKRIKSNLLTQSTTPADQANTGMVFAIATVLLTLSFIITIWQLLTAQKPLILPFAVGFQTAFAAISQDVNVFKGFLLGSGFGTFLTDFTRFKPASYNLNQTLWSYTFVRSSSFVLELLATTGVLGLGSFLFIVYKVIKQRILFLPVAVALVAAFLLPFSPIIYILLFVILAIYASLYSLNNQRSSPELEFNFVALKKGLFSSTPEGEGERSRFQGGSMILPLIAELIILVLLGWGGTYIVNYVVSDVMFQKSLITASQNNGQTTYNLEKNAIAIFPYRDAYYRIFAQTNLSLANSLAASQPKNSKPDATVQNNVLTLIQQSITAARAAVTVAPNTALDWNTLSDIYRSLIGFGQNAENFSVVSNQQAIALDPNNPQQYVNLGGIYYQLGQWDNAQSQFMQAVKIKPDYANAYYNLGHTLESKNDLADALQAYQYVQQLVANDPTNTGKINSEIKALQTKISQQSKNGSQVSNIPTPSNTESNTAATNQSINVNNPTTQLPARNPKATIPGPTISPIPTSSVTSPTPSKSVTVSPTTTP